VYRPPRGPVQIIAAIAPERGILLGI